MPKTINLYKIAYLQKLTNKEIFLLLQQIFTGIIESHLRVIKFWHFSIRADQPETGNNRGLVGENNNVQETTANGNFLKRQLKLYQLPFIKLR